MTFINCYYVTIFTFFEVVHKLQFLSLLFFVNLLFALKL